MRGGHSESGILDGIAQVGLAKCDLSLCDRALERMTGGGRKEDPLSYYSLWSDVTRIRVSMARRQWNAAASALASLQRDLPAEADPTITNLLRLLKAEVGLVTGHRTEAARLIYDAASSTTAPSVEVLAETARVAGKALARDGALGPAVAQFERAAVLLASVGHLQARFEVLDAYREAAWPELEGTPPSAARPRSLPRRPRRLTIHSDSAAHLLPLPPPGPSAAVERAAALLDLAAYPEVFGREIFALLRDTNAAREVVLTADGPRTPRHIVAHAGCSYARARTLAASRRAAIRLPLGTWHDRPCQVHINPGDTVASRLTVLAIEKIAAAALQLETARREARERTALWPVEPREDHEGAVFASRLMMDHVATLRKVAPTNATILLTGETGTGKEVCARLIHRASLRADRPLVPFNCTAHPRDLIDSQLFGYRRGAFTGAHADFPGVIRGAAGGTLFLDEIGELLPEVQPKLLRFLESGEVLPLGESKPTVVDVRVIASTNADLEQYVKDGRFREDLFYRLKVIRVRLPPLRERREEIPPLVEHFLERHGREYHRERLRLAEETMEYLLLYHWPGNVRELANEMRRLVALAEDGAVLMPEHLSPEITAGRRTVPAAERPLRPIELVVRTDQPLSAATEHLERAMILRALAASGGRLEEAARALGLSRKGLYLKRRRLGIGDDSPA